MSEAVGLNSHQVSNRGAALEICGSGFGGVTMIGDLHWHFVRGHRWQSCGTFGWMKRLSIFTWTSVLWISTKGLFARF